MAKWSVHLPVAGGTVGPAMVVGRPVIQLTQAAHLNTREQFVPSANAPVHISGEWQSGYASDGLSVVTRSSGIGDAMSGDTTAGIECKLLSSGGSSTLTVKANGTQIASAPVTDVLNGNSYLFDMFDDGTNIRCQVTNQYGVAASGVVTATSTVQNPNNFISVHNQKGLNSQGNVSLLSIEQGIRMSASHMWSFEGQQNFVSPAHIGSVNAALLGITPSPGVFGSAAGLGFGTSGVTMGNTVGNFGTAPFSISFWFKTTSTRSLVELVGNRNSGNCFVSAGTRLGYRGVGQSEFEVDIRGSCLPNDPDSVVFNITGLSLHDGQWHHAAVTREGRRVEAFIDGVKRLSQSSMNVGNIVNTTPFSAGRTMNGAAQFVGDFDDVRVYPHALNTCEVAALRAGY